MIHRQLLLAILSSAVLTLLPACFASQPPPPKYEPPDERFVLFTSGSSDITNTDGFFSLGYVAALLDQHPGYHVLVVGHADTTGTTEKNRELCFKRAASVRKLLLARGVAEPRVTIAAPKALETGTSATLSRRADVYLHDPSKEDVTKRLGYEVEIRKD